MGSSASLCRRSLCRPRGLINAGGVRGAQETMVADTLTHKRGMVTTEHQRYEGMREKGLFATARTLGEKTEGSMFLTKFLAEQESNKHQQQ
jgi:hypothetical protein